MPAMNQQHKSLWAEVLRGHEHVSIMLADPAHRIGLATKYYYQGMHWYNQSRYDTAAFLFDLAISKIRGHRDPLEILAVTQLEKAWGSYIRQLEEKRSRAESAHLVYARA